MNEKIEKRIVLGPYDRIDTNPDNNGGPFWGKDLENGYTYWYNNYGDIDCATLTPSEDSEYQRKLEDGERYHINIIQ